VKRVAIPSWSAETATWGDNSIVVSVDRDGDVEFDLSGSLAGRSFIVDSRELCDALRKLGVIPDDQPAAEPGEYPRYESDFESVKRADVRGDAGDPVSSPAWQVHMERLEERLSALESRFQNTLEVNELWDGS